MARPPADALRWVSLAAICTAAGIVWLAFADLAVAIPTIADAVVDAFSSGVAQTMVATGVLVLLAAGAVALVWPRADPTAPTPAETSETPTSTRP